MKRPASRHPRRHDSGAVPSRLLAAGLAVAIVAALVIVLVVQTHRAVPRTAASLDSPSATAASGTPARPSASASPGTPDSSPTARPASTPPGVPHTPSPAGRPLQTVPPGGGGGPATSLHYAANDNWSGDTYVPGATGFNLADISSPGLLSSLPANSRALAYVGQCDGTAAGSQFLQAVQGFHASPKLFGFYLMDEPHPASCSAANLMAEADWVHTHVPGAKAFIVLENQSATKSPTYMNTYNPANTHVDLFGLDPYPCRTELNGCSDSWIPLAVRAAESAGVPLADIVPVYQTFGGGAWADDGGGQYMLPTAQQEVSLLADWAKVVPSPAFDYCYSWGSQNADVALAQTPGLQAVIRRHNGG